MSKKESIVEGEEKGVVYCFKCKERKPCSCDLRELEKEERLSLFHEVGWLMLGGEA